MDRTFFAFFSPAFCGSIAVCTFLPAARARPGGALRTSCILGGAALAIAGSVFWSAWSS